MSKLVLDEKNILPLGWTTASLNDVCIKIIDGVHKTPNYMDDGIRFISISNIRPFEIILENYVRYISKDEHAEICKSVKPIKDDILLTKIGTLGYAKIVDWDWDFNIFVGLALLRPKKDILIPKFFEIILNCPQITKETIKNANGSGRKTLPLMNIRPIIIPIPPLNEQKRIIKKVEELFSLVNNNQIIIEKTIVKINLFLDSFIKNLFDGTLTKSWRKTNQFIIPVKNILEQKHASKIIKKRKTVLDKTLLPKLPNTWDWVNFDDLAENSRHAIKAGPFGSSLKKDCYVEKGYKVYGQEQVIQNDPNFGNYYIDEKKFLELQSCEVKSGDLLISLVGTIGKTMVLPEGSKKGIINPRLIKISLDHDIVDPRFIQIYFQSGAATSFFKISSHGGTMSILNMGILKKLPIPLPPICEQKQIVMQYERELSLVNSSKDILQNLQNLCRILKNKILNDAFKGKIVPQDPNDESLEILLEKIKQKKQKIISQTIRGKKNDK